MFERYVLSDQRGAEREFQPQRVWWKFGVRYNVAPGHYVPAVRLHNRESEAVMMRWGFVPSWAEGKPAQEPSHSVPRERLEGSQSYRLPWLGGQRCILPVAGFYVWQLTSERYRQPYFVQLTARTVFGLAAVWDRSETGEGDVIESCSVIMVGANSLLGGIANQDHRMPVILRRRDYDRWLRGRPGEARELLQPYPSQWMLAHTVSPRVNSTEPDDAGLIRSAPSYRLENSSFQPPEASQSLAMPP
jgi:putative SOS response-associated peptidase YedK